MIPIEQIRTQREVEDIYQRHVDMVYQICIMFMKTIPDAEDVTQTVFRKVMEYRKPFRDIEHEKAWLIVTAQNECKNQLRHWWRTKRASEETYQKLTWKEPAQEELWEYVLSLPEKYRMVLYLHYYHGYTTLEISQILNQNHSTVRTWLVKARYKLKHILEEEENAKA